MSPQAPGLVPPPPGRISGIKYTLSIFSGGRGFRILPTHTFRVAGFLHFTSLVHTSFGRPGCCILHTHYYRHFSGSRGTIGGRGFYFHLGSLFRGLELPGVGPQGTPLPRWPTGGPTELTSPFALLALWSTLGCSRGARPRRRSGVSRAFNHRLRFLWMQICSNPTAASCSARRM